MSQEGTVAHHIGQARLLLDTGATKLDGDVSTYETPTVLRVLDQLDTAQSLCRTDRAAKPLHTGHFPEPSAGDVRSRVGRDLQAYEVSKLVALGLVHMLTKTLRGFVPEWTERVRSGRGQAPYQSGAFMFSEVRDRLASIPDDPDEEVVVPSPVPWSLSVHVTDLLSTSRPDSRILYEVRGRVGQVFVRYEVTYTGEVRLVDDTA